MSERTTSMVRIPTMRLRPALDAAIAAANAERWAKVNEAIAEEMAIPAPTGWWGRRFGKRPAATRDEALARVKAQPDDFPRWSAWDEIWFRGRETRERLARLKDACDLGLDAVDVSVDDVALFKAHFDPRAEGYR